MDKVELEEGQLFFIISRGVEHLRVTEEEGVVLLLEPKSVLNTGKQQSDGSVNNPDWI